jgi:hypothetical protein
MEAATLIAAVCGFDTVNVSLLSSSPFVSASRPVEPSQVPFAPERVRVRNQDEDKPLTLLFGFEKSLHPDPTQSVGAFGESRTVKRPS